MASQKIEDFDPANLKTPVHGFHTAVRANGFVYLAGMTGRVADGSVVAGFEPQVRVAMERIREGFELAGVQPNGIVQLMFFLVAREEQSFAEDFAVVMKLKDDILSGCEPVGTAIRVSELVNQPQDNAFLIEIQAVAVAA